MSQKRYRCFTRSWWVENPLWPNGLEPGAGPQKFLSWASTIEEAQTICKHYNASHDPGRYSYKAEFEDWR